MSLFKKTNKKRKYEKRQPDELGQVSDTIGVAIWCNEDGDHDVKVGPCISRAGKDLVVKMTTPLSLLPDWVMAVAMLAETYSRDTALPQSLRRTLHELATRLDAALSEPATSGPQSNGAASFGAGF